MSQIKLRPLTAPVAPEFSAMTFSAYRHLLNLERTSRHPVEGDRKQIDPWALGAWLRDEPAGLLLAELPVEDAERADLLSIFVTPSHRRRGIAEALIQETEKRLRRRSRRHLCAVYTTGKPGVAYLERLVARRGWEPPRGRTLSVRFTPESAFASDLLTERRLRVQQRGLEIVPWSEITPEDIDAIRRSDEESSWIAPMLAPWRFDRHGFDPSSVAARYRGQIVGWVITHRISLDEVRFTCSFMRKDLSRRGRILPLYSAVLESLKTTPCRYCTFITPFSYPEMVRFIRQRLAPISEFIGETREVRVDLTTP